MSGVVARDRVALIPQSRIERKERQRKQGSWIWQCEPNPWSSLISFLKCWRQKLWDMFSGQQHIPLGVFPSDVSQTEYTTCLISSWTTSITWECERNFGCQNLLWSFFQGSIPIKTWDNHNSESLFVIRLGHVRNFRLWKVFELWTEPTCMSSVKAYFSFQLPLFSFSLHLSLSLSHPQMVLPHLITAKMLTNNYDFRWCHVQRLVGWILTEKVASTKPHSKGSTTNFHSKVETASTT